MVLVTSSPQSDLLVVRPHTPGCLCRLAARRADPGEGLPAGPVGGPPAAVRAVHGPAALLPRHGASGQLDEQTRGTEPPRSSSDLFPPDVVSEKRGGGRRLVRLSHVQAFLLNEDLGDSLDSVEALLKKHEDFEKSLSAQEEKITVGPPLKSACWLEPGR